MKKVNYRQEARGRECQIRSEYCNWNPETVVLCHLNGAGVGMKHDDKLGAWGCSDCHDYVDGRRHWIHDTSPIVQLRRNLALLEGIVRTQAILIAEGKL